MPGLGLPRRPARGPAAVIGLSSLPFSGLVGGPGHTTPISDRISASPEERSCAVVERPVCPEVVVEAVALSCHIGCPSNGIESAPSKIASPPHVLRVLRDFSGISHQRIAAAGGSHPFGLLGSRSESPRAPPPCSRSIGHRLSLRTPGDEYRTTAGRRTPCPGPHATEPCPAFASRPRSPCA